MGYGWSEAVSLGFNIWGTYEENQAIEAESDAAEAALKFNAAQNRLEATRVRRVGAETEFEMKIQNRRQVARNRVGTAAAGVGSTGSTLDAELMMMNDLASNIAILEESTRFRAQKLETLADLQMEQARDVRRAGKDRERANWLNLVGDALSLF